KETIEIKANGIHTIFTKRPSPVSEEKAIGKRKPKNPKAAANIRGKTIPQKSRFVSLQLSSGYSIGAEAVSRPVGFPQ
ncbi:MAG: hypothetical protein J6N21_19640, partial [Butyrivibrio sp.]|nr:hypothetical protein [Butyrivibrio sp.]